MPSGSEQKLILPSVDLDKTSKESNSFPKRLPNVFKNQDLFKKQLAKLFISKEFKKKNTNRSGSVSVPKDTLKGNKIFSKDVASKLLSFLSKKKECKAKDFLGLMNEKMGEKQISVLENSIKVQRVENKTLFKTIKHTEGLLKTLEIRFMKIQNDRHLQSDTIESSVIAKTLTEILRINDKYTHPKCLFTSVVQNLNESYNEPCEGSEARPDKIREKQKKLVYRLIEEDLDWKKLNQQLQDLMGLITKQAKKIETEERTIKRKRSISSRLSLADEKNSQKKSHRMSSSNLSKALRTFFKQKTNKESKKNNSIFARTISANSPNVKGGRSFQPHSTMESIYMKTDPILMPSRENLGAFIPSGRGKSMFGKFSHFDGSINDLPSRESLSIFKTGKPNVRRSEHIYFQNNLGFKPFKTSQNNHLSIANNKIRKSSSKTSIERGLAQVDREMFKFPPSLPEACSKKQRKDSISQNDLNSKINKLLKNKFGGNPKPAKKKKKKNRAKSPSVSKRKKDKYLITPDKQFFYTLNNPDDLKKKRSKSPKKKRGKGHKNEKRAKSNRLAKKNHEFKKNKADNLDLNHKKKKIPGDKKLDLTGVKSKINTKKKTKLNRNNIKISFPGKDIFQFDKKKINSTRRNPKIENEKDRNLKQKKTKKNKTNDDTKKKNVKVQDSNPERKKNNKKNKEKNAHIGKHKKISLYKGPKKSKKSGNVKNKLSKSKVSIKTSEPVKAKKNGNTNNNLFRSEILRDKFVKNKKKKKKKRRKTRKSNLSDTMFSPGKKIKYDNITLSILKPSNKSIGSLEEIPKPKLFKSEIPKTEYTEEKKLGALSDIQSRPMATSGNSTFFDNHQKCLRNPNLANFRMLNRKRMMLLFRKNSKTK